MVIAERCASEAADVVVVVEDDDGGLWLMQTALHLCLTQVFKGLLNKTFCCTESYFHIFVSFVTKMAN